MKAVFKGLIVKAEQYTKKGALPSFARKAGTHATGIYVMSEGRPKLLREKDWVVQDGFGAVFVYSNEDFNRLFAEVA